MKRAAVGMTALLLVLAAPAGARTSLVEVRLGPGDAALLERSFDVTHDVTAARARVLLHGDADRERLARTFPSRTLLDDVEAAVQRDAAAPAASAALPSGRTGYRVLAHYEGELQALAAAHPGLVRVVTLGTSVQGRPILGVEIARDVHRVDDGRPVFAAFGLHHAREWPSGEVTMEFALELVGRYGSDPRWTAVADDVRSVVVPVVNPDGFVMSRGTLEALPAGLDPLHRKNAAEVDLNRNYGAGWGGIGASTDPSSDSFRGPAPFSEPESRAVHDFTRTRQVTGVQSTHNIVGQVLRQPGFQDYGTTSPDEARMKALGDRMAEATGYDSLLGHELYPVHGATEDWNYIEQGALGYTIELGPKGDAPLFMGPFQTHVIDQYDGGGTGGPAGKGMREALLLAAEAAGDARDHGVLSGAAPAGATLRVRRTFTTDSVPVCPDDGCATRAPVIAQPDFAESTLVVGASGSFAWHLTPSTRPWEGRVGRIEAWTLTCTLGASVVVAKELVVARGDRATTNPCDPASPVVRNGVAPPPTRGVDPPGSAPELSVAVGRTRLRDVLRRGVPVRARCSTRCEATVSVRVGRRVVARRTLRLRAGRTLGFRVRVLRSRRALVRRSVGRRLDVVLVATGASGPPVSVTRSVRLARR